MDSETSTGHNIDLLERVLLDGNAAPTYVPLSLLEYITNSFSDERRIGSGGFAVVYKGVVGKGVVAVKKLSKTSDLPESKFHREIECLTKAKHKNIVRFLGYCSEVQGRIADYEGKFVMSDIRNWLLCFEYIPNGSLDKHITDASRGLEWRKRYEIIKGICEGLLHLHEKRILHLDLKPGNILVDEHMVPKITDFGLSMCLGEDQTQAFTTNLCGSSGYVPPEFLRGQQSKGQRGFASDIYSLGVIIGEILKGEKWYPEDENVEQVLYSWMNRLEGSDQWDLQLQQVSLCMKIGVECMDLNPKKRPIARHIIDRLDEMTSTVKTGISSLSVKQQVVESWMGRLDGSDQRDTQLEQVRVCTKIEMDCMDLDPKKRSDASHIIDSLGKTATTVETGINGSAVGQQVSFLKEQCCQDKIATPSSEYLGNDIKEHTKTGELVGYVGTPREDHWQPGQEEAPHDEWSSWEAQDTEQNVSPQASASFSSSNSGVLGKLNSLEIFNTKARKNYVKNGGPVLEKIKFVKLIKKRDLKTILNYSNIIGKGYFGEVYKGFVDNVPVAVKKPNSGTVLQNGQFENEVIIQSRIRHRNIVQLIGVCLDADIPMLVYEFVSRGSLHDILHCNKSVPLNLGLRLSIVAQSARGLAYLHSMTSSTILHGCVNASNILLDEDFVPKISDTGISRMFEHDHGMIVGAMACMDPVYLQTGLLTQKTDVYSLGVVIWELLTRKVATTAGNYSLLSKILENHNQGRKSTELFDEEIALVKDLELLDTLAEMAMECLNLDPDRRPTMMDVAKRLSVLHKDRELALLQASRVGTI